MYIARKATKGVILLTGVQISGMLISLIANIILARMLMPEDFGVFSLALSLTEIFFIFTAWSFGLAVIQIKNVSQEFIDTGYILSVIVGFATMIIVLVSSLALRRFFSSQVLYFLCIFSALNFLNILGNYKATLLERKLDYEKYSVIHFSMRIIPWLGAVILAWVGAGAWSFVGQQAIMTLIVFFGFNALCDHKVKWQLDWEAMKRLTKFGGQMLVSRGLEVGFYRIGYLAVGTLMGTAKLGFFNQAMTFAEMGNRIGRPALGQVSFAAYSRLQDEKDKLSKGYDLINYFLIRLLTPVALVMLIIGSQVIIFLCGKNWQDAGPILQALAIYCLALPVYENLKELLYSQNKINGAIIARLAQLCFLAPGIYFGLEIFGLLGVVYALDIGVIIGIVVIYLSSRNMIRVEIKSLLFPPFLAALGALGLWRIAFEKMGDWQPHFGDVALGTILIFSTYICFLYVIERRRMKVYLSSLFKTLGIERFKFNVAVGL